MASSCGCLITVILSLGLFVLASGDWKQHYRYSKKGAPRNRRQLEGGPQAVDLNITVPFIFSARLYPYGVEKGDHKLDAKKNNEALELKHDLIYLGQNHSTIYISRDGVVAFQPGIENAARQFPNGRKAIAVYWTPVNIDESSQVYYRESKDDNILQLAGSEVQIQYHYTDFRPQSVVVITWVNVSSPLTPKGLPNNTQRNIFQAALIIGENETFAHFVYSKLKWHNDAIAGFNQGDNKYVFNLPGSKSSEVMKLANDSDLGIPGEWLFKLDGPSINLCGQGFKGLECVDKCQKNEFSFDCSRKCHCENKQACDLTTGFCPTETCGTGWENPPICDTDINECADVRSVLCDGEKPDCVNTPGAYVCTCLAGFDNVTNTCPVRPQPNAGLLKNIPTQPVKTTPPTTRKPILVVNTPVGLPVNLPHSARVQPDAEAPFRAAVAISVKTTVATTKATTSKPSPTTRRQRLPVPPQPRELTLTVSNTVQRVKEEQTIETTTTATTNKTNNETEEYDDAEEDVSSVTVVPEVLKPVLPPGIPFLTTKAVPTSTVHFLCDLQCVENAHCEFQRGTMKCVCNRGWTGDGEFCLDVNECFLENACEPNAKCQNTIGSYNCLCEPGFQSDGKSCFDVDECQEGPIQCPGGNSSLCVNTPGSYECRCAQGYNGNPLSTLGCIDINECLIPEFYCGPSAECENFAGSFVCHCHTGYQRNADATDCEDINECKASPCSNSAICHNSPGSFTCMCLDGYSGDGFTCQETILFPFSRTDDQRLPQERNAVVEVPLSKPVKLLGKTFDHFYVSANGIVTFDRPMEIYSELPVGETRRLGLAPLYQKVDLTRGGGIYVKVSTEYLPLARATNVINDDFYEPNFKANLLIVITFDEVIQLNQLDDSKRSTFQIVLVAGEEGTYVSYIYDRISNDKAQVAIVAPEPPRSVVATVSGLNATLMRETSNVNIPGKWIYRVDEKTVVQCPAGFVGPPYCNNNCPPGSWGQSCAKSCQCADSIPCDFKSGYCSNHACIEGFTGENCYQDINECGLEKRLCHERASCTNTVGSYKCTCELGWTGDGVQCFEITPCLLNSGLVCGPNAGCFVPSNGSGDPHCICNAGFHGDGIQCGTAVTKVPILNATVHFGNETHDNENLTTTSARPTPASTSITFVTTKTANRTTAAIEARTTTTTQINLFDSEEQTETTVVHTTERRTTPTTTVETGVNQNVVSAEQNGAKKVQPNHDKKRNGSPDAATAQSVLVIIIPAVLCGVWLVLIAVLIVVCIRRRKQNQRDQYGNSYYLPTNTPNVHSSTLQSAYNAHGSQYNQPRSSYEYYKGYYPEFYNAYKY